MNAYMASIVKRVRMLVGMTNFELTCDLLGDPHWEIVISHVMDVDGECGRRTYI